MSKVLISRSSTFAATAAFAALAFAAGTHAASNSVDQVIANMSPNTSLHRHPFNQFDYCGPDFGGKPNYPTAQSGFAALTGWGGIDRDVTDSQDTNTRIAIKGFQSYLLSKSTGKWSLIQSGDIQGSTITEDWTTWGGDGGQVRTESDGAVSVKIPHGYIFHFWPGNRVAPSNVSDIAALFFVFQARLVVDNASLNDDRSIAQYLMNSGADWWTAVSSSTNRQILTSGFERVTNDYKSVYALAYNDSPTCGGSDGVRDPNRVSLTAANIAALRANPPPGLTTGTVTVTVPQPPSQITVH